MKQFIFAAALCVGGVMSASSAFADRWVQPVNGTVSAVTMQNDDVMMKIQVPAKIFVTMDRDMKANHGSCTIRQIYADQPDTMIVVCGAAIDGSDPG